MLNGLTSINLTKLDVLSKLDTIELGVAYRDKRTGKVLDAYPSDVQTLEEVEVVYESHPGWKSDISQCKTYGELPANGEYACGKGASSPSSAMLPMPGTLSPPTAARKYVERIEQLLGVPISWIGVGPGRQAMVIKN